MMSSFLINISSREITQRAHPIPSHLTGLSLATLVVLGTCSCALANIRAHACILVGASEECPREPTTTRNLLATMAQTVLLLEHKSQETRDCKISDSITLGRKVSLQLLVALGDT